MNKQTQPLYHGTDLRILMMSKEERQSFKDSCILAIDYMWTFIEPLTIETKVLKKVDFHPLPIWVSETKLESLKPLFETHEEPYLYENFVEAISCNRCRLSGSLMYQYDNTYLTAESRNVMNYASNSFRFGEVGQIAYRFFQAIEILKPHEWDPSIEVCQAIERLVSFVEGEKQPVVVLVYDYDMNYLFSQRGKPATSMMHDGKLFGHFFYVKELVFKPEDAIPLSDFIALVKRGEKE